MTEITGFGIMTEVVYPNAYTVLLPVPHSEDSSDEKMTTNESIRSATSSGSEFWPDILSRKGPLSQEELDDVIRDFELPKDKAECLASLFFHRGFLKDGVKVSIYRNRDKRFSQHYEKSENVCFCKDVPALFAELID